MGAENTNNRHRAVTSIGCIALVIVCCLGVWWLKEVSKSVVAQYDSISQRTSQTSVSEAARFMYISVPGAKKLFLVESPYKYKNQTDVWALVNKTRGIALDYTPTALTAVPMATYNNEPLLVRSELVEPLKQLNSAAKSAGVQLMVRSAYRSSSDQAAVTKEVDQGLAAVPGQSEHQTGLAVDFNNQPTQCGSYCYLSDANAAWLAQNAYKYGFVLRYEPGREAITGYPAEAWHYRYVGTRVAQALHDSGLTYEEFYTLFATARPRS